MSEVKNTVKKEKAPRPSANAKKLSARLLAVQAVFQASLNEQDLVSAAEEYLAHRVSMEVDGEEIVKANGALFEMIVHGVAERKADLGEVIQANMSKSGENTEPLIRSILMCAGYELLANHDVDKGIIFNDYLNVAHCFFAQGEVSLINGILNGVAKALRDS